MFIRYWSENFNSNINRKNLPEYRLANFENIDQKIYDNTLIKNFLPKYNLKTSSEI